MTLINKPLLGQLPNWGRSINKGLVGAWLNSEGAAALGTLHDFSGNGHHGTLVSGVYSIPGKFGPVLTWPSTNDYVGLPTTLPELRTNDFTILLWCRMLQDGANRCLISKGVGTEAGGFWFYKRNSDALRFYADNGGIDVKWGANDTVPNDVWIQAVARRIGSSITIFQDAVQGETDSTASSDLTHADGWRVGLDGNSGLDYTGEIDHILIYNRGLSASEIHSLYIDPSHGWRRDPIELWTAAGGAGVVDVTPTPIAQSLTLTAPAPTIVISDVETPAAQALTLASPAPTPSVSADPSAQALTLAAPAPTVIGDVAPTPAAQALTLAAPAPAVQIDATVTPAALSLTLAAPAPTVDTAGNVTVQPSAIALTLSAPAPAIQVDATVSPATQAITLAAPAPVIDVSGSVTAQPADLALSLTAPAPTITIDATLTPSALALTLSIPAPAPAVTFLPAAQAITLAAPAPSVRLGSTFSAPAQSLTLGSPGPTISADVAMAAAAFLLINRSRK